MGEKWNLAKPIIADPNTDPRLVAGQTIVVAGNRNNAFSLADNSKVRIMVYTSAALNAANITTANAKDLMQKGHLMDERDWHNVEITAYIYVMTRTSGVVNGGPSLRLVARGGRQGLAYHDGYEGVSYHAVVMLDGSKTIKLQKELRSKAEDNEDYPSTADPVSTLDYDPYNRWIGIKFVIYNISANGNVRLELWMDESVSQLDGQAGNGWKKKMEWNDAGQWCYDPNSDIGNDNNLCQKITWGGPIVMFRWDNLDLVWFKNFSVREILPLGNIGIPNAYPVSLALSEQLTTTTESTSDYVDDGDPPTPLPIETTTIDKKDIFQIVAQTEDNPIKILPDKEIYPTKSGGDVWYQTPTSDLMKDKRFSIYPNDGSVFNQTYYQNPKIDQDGNPIFEDWSNFIESNFIPDNFLVQTNDSLKEILVDYNEAAMFQIISSPYKICLAISTTSIKYFPWLITKSILTTNQSELAKQGFMYDENDFTNVEITAYVNLLELANGDKDGKISFVVRTGAPCGEDISKTVNNDPCSEVGYSVQFFYKSRQVRVVKLLSGERQGAYIFGRSIINNVLPDLRNRWIGIKAAIFNYKDVDTKSNIVIIEAYVDTSENADGSNWTKVMSVKDDGRFRKSSNRAKSMVCNGDPGQIITWGGPFVRMELDNIQMFQFKKVSAREIECDPNDHNLNIDTVADSAISLRGV